MGPEFAAVLPYLGAAASIVGPMIQGNAVDDAQQRSDQAFRQNMLRDQQYQDKAQNLVTQNADQYAAPVRQANTQTAQDKALSSLTGSLEAARVAEPSTGAAGKVSADYLTDNAKRTAETLQKSTDWARLLAKQRAPNDLRAGEAMTNADFAARGGSLGADRTAMAGAGSMDAGVAGRPDGMQMMLGGAAGGIGTSLLAQGLMKKAKPSPEMFPG